MEANLNCDLGEKSHHYDGKNDEILMQIINTANIACGFHAGDNETMSQTIKLAKINNISIGAHPSFDDKENFGRKRIYLSETEVTKLVIDQINILNELAQQADMELTHIKPHGALNNMACENYELSLTIGSAIKEYNPNLIYMGLPLTEMERAAKKLNLKFAAEIFADRNYDDSGLLLSRDKENSLITEPQKAVDNVKRMLEHKAIYCYSGKKISCDIDTICIHGDGVSAVEIADYLNKELIKDGFVMKKLDQLSKFN